MPVLARRGWPGSVPSFPEVPHFRTPPLSRQRDCGKRTWASICAAARVRALNVLLVLAVL
jgi:hypothetical protein